MLLVTMQKPLGQPNPNPVSFLEVWAHISHAFCSSSFSSSASMSQQVAVRQRLSDSVRFAKGWWCSLLAPPLRRLRLAKDLLLAALEAFDRDDQLRIVEEGGDQSGQQRTLRMQAELGSRPLA